MKGWSKERKAAQRELNWDVRLQHYAAHNPAMFVKMTDDWAARSFPYNGVLAGDMIHILYISREHGILSDTMIDFGRAAEEIFAEMYEDEERERVATRPRHTPGIKLTHDQRNAKSEQHNFGLCCDCDAGLDDRTDFIIGNNDTHTRFLCNDCSAYYIESCTALRVRRFITKIDDMNVCDL